MSAPEGKIYPVPITAFLHFLQASNFAETGDQLLVFQDETGYQVTLRLHAAAVVQLQEALAAGPTPAQP